MMFIEKFALKVLEYSVYSFVVLVLYISIFPAMELRMIRDRTVWPVARYSLTP